MAAHETMREVTCVNWHSAADNYWKWDQEVPEHCYRKYPTSQKCRSCSLLKRSHNTFNTNTNSFLQLLTAHWVSCQTSTRTGQMSKGLGGTMSSHIKPLSSELFRHTWAVLGFFYLIPLSHQCKTFGQAFQRDDGTFYSTFGVTCQWDKKWTTSVIPHPCKCKHFLMISLLIDYSITHLLLLQLFCRGKVYCSASCTRRAQTDCCLEALWCAK